MSAFRRSWSVVWGLPKALIYCFFWWPSMSKRTDCHPGAQLLPGMCAWSVLTSFLLPAHRPVRVSWEPCPLSPAIWTVTTGSSSDLLPLGPVSTSSGNLAGWPYHFLTCLSVLHPAALCINGIIFRSILQTLVNSSSAPTSAFPHIKTLLICSSITSHYC